MRVETGLALILMVAAAGATTPLIAENAPSGPPELPLEEEIWRPLLASRDDQLQKRLSDRLARHQELSGLVRRSKLTVGLVDLREPDSPRLASLNGSTMMYAASLPKIAVLLAAVQAFEDGDLEESDEVLADLEAMIRVSSNSAATRVIDRLGFERIQETLRRYELFDPPRGGGLWVGKRYAKAGRRVPDPLAGLTHGATADQVCRFYYLLATGKLVSPSRSAQMLDILVDPGIHHKFVEVLEKRAPGASLYRKSGTWKVWHSDSVLVWGPVWRRYILVAMVEHPEGERLLQELVPVVEQVLLDLER